MRVSRGPEGRLAGFAPELQPGILLCVMCDAATPIDEGGAMCGIVLS
jgi:hypothetical protein